MQLRRYLEMGISLCQEAFRIINGHRVAVESGRETKAASFKNWAVQVGFHMDVHTGAVEALSALCDQVRMLEQIAGYAAAD